MSQRFLPAYRPGPALLSEPHRCSNLKKGLGLASLALGGAAGGYLGYKLIVGVWGSTPSSAEDRRALRQAVIGGAVFGLTLGVVRLARHQLCDPL